MRSLTISLLSAFLLLLVHARPRWLQPKNEMNNNILGPRVYSVYQTTSTNYGYIYGGYGPAPTASSFATFTVLQTPSDGSVEVSATKSSYLSSSTETFHSLQLTTAPVAICSTILNATECMIATSTFTEIPEQTTSSPIDMSTFLSSSSVPSGYSISSSDNSSPNSSPVVTSNALGIATSLSSSSTPIVYGSNSTSSVSSDTTLFTSSSSGDATSSDGGIATSLSSSITNVYGSTSANPSPVESSGQTISSAIGTATNFQTSVISTNFGSPSSMDSHSSDSSSKFVETSVYASITSLPDPASMTASSSPNSTPVKNLLCNHNNCLRQMIRSSSLATGFCATYTTSMNTATTGIPAYFSACKNSPSAISSACSCIDPVAPTHTTWTIGTVGASSSTISLPPIWATSISRATSNIHNFTKTGEVTETMISDGPTTSIVGGSLTTGLLDTISSLPVTKSGESGPRTTLSGVSNYPSSAPYPMSNFSTVIKFPGTAPTISSESSTLGFTETSLSTPIHSTVSVTYSTSNGSTYVLTVSRSSASSAAGTVTSKSSFIPLSESKSFGTAPIYSSLTVPYPSSNASSNVATASGAIASSEIGIETWSIPSKPTPPYPANSTFIYIGSTGVTSATTLHVTSVITITVPASSDTSFGAPTSSVITSEASGPSVVLSTNSGVPFYTSSLALGIPTYSSVRASISSSSAPYPFVNSTSRVSGTGYSTGGIPGIPLSTSIEHSTASAIGIFTSLSPTAISSSAAYSTHDSTSAVNPTLDSSISVVIPSSSPPIGHSTSSSPYVIPSNATSLVADPVSTSESAYTTLSTLSEPYFPSNTSSTLGFVGVGSAMTLSSYSRSSSTIVNSTSTADGVFGSGSSSTVAFETTPPTSCTVEHGYYAPSILVTSTSSIETRTLGPTTEWTNAGTSATTTSSSGYTLGY